MNDESNKRSRFSLYGTALFHGVGDAAIVFLPACFLLLICHVLVVRIWGEQPLISLVLEALAMAVIVAAVVRAARNVARARIAADRRAGGQCLDCEYDLRASSEHCPECGRPIRYARYGGSGT